MWASLIATYLLNLFDLAMTNRLVNMYGLSVEGNPLGRWLYSTDTALFTKVFGVGGILAMLGHITKKHPQYAWAIYIPLVAYGLLAIYHIGIWTII